MRLLSSCTSALHYAMHALRPSVRPSILDGHRSQSEMKVHSWRSLYLRLTEVDEVFIGGVR